MQRVRSARVLVKDQVVGEIGVGLLVLLGIGKDDTIGDAEWLADKISTIRVFEDGMGKMNLSVGDVMGSVLAVSQFTLYGDVKKGRRPSFTEAAPPAWGQYLFDHAVSAMKSRGLPLETGEFGADMLVEIANDGPCTIIIDTGI